jgi:hypothetical protein
VGNESHYVAVPPDRDPNPAKIKEIAETPIVPPTLAPGVPGAGRLGFGDPSFWPRRSAVVLLNVRDRMGEAAAFALAASTQAYPKIQREPKQ